VSALITEPVVLEVMVCLGCGITYAVPKHWIENKRREAGAFHCPNGCSRVYAESEADRLRRQLEAKEIELRQSKCEAMRQRSLREAAELSLANSDRKLRRVKNGVCPCCKRSFVNLRRHMATKHPEKKVAVA